MKKVISSSDNSLLLTCYSHILLMKIANASIIIIFLLAPVIVLPLDCCASLELFPIGNDQVPIGLHSHLYKSLKEYLFFYP